MLEPLIMGELSYTQKESDIDIEMINNLLKYLNTSQISKKLITELMKRNLYNSAWKLMESCPQLSKEDKDEFITELRKDKNTFELIYGIQEKEATNQTPLESTLEEEIYQKLSEDWEYNFGINSKESISHKSTIDTLDILGTMNISHSDILKVIEDEKDISEENTKFLDIIKFGAGNIQNSEQKDTAVSLNFNLSEFSYQVSVTMNDDEKESMPSVMNDNVERYLGYGSLDINSDAVQPPTDMIGEEHSQKEDNYYEDALGPDEDYENLEELNYIMILYRFDQGLGAKIVDYSDNKNHGSILKEGTIVENDHSKEYWEFGQLEPEKPLTFEDEWGKDSPPNCAVTFYGAESLRVRGSKNLAKLKGNFSFQVWVRLEEIHQFTLFKRQSEDFNVRVKGSKTIEISRAHSIRNILSFELSQELPLEEWVNISLVYRQLQKEEEANEDVGLKIYLNSEKVFEDCKLNFKWPLYETDGLIFFQDFKGAFTELRFWNTNISSNIIKESYNKILGCVYEQRKRIQMDDDQFSFLNQKRKKAKRGTLVAPPGKSLGGLRASLRKPPRGSVRALPGKISTGKEKKIEMRIKEEDGEDEENEEVIDTSTKKEPEKKQEEGDDFEFEFDSTESKDTEKPKETFWDDDDGFEAQIPSKEKEGNFGDFDWSTKKQEEKVNDDGFDWEDDQAQNEDKNKSNEDWDFEEKETQDKKPQDDGFTDDTPQEDFDVSQESPQNNEEYPEDDQDRNHELDPDAQDEDLQYAHERDQESYQDPQNEIEAENADQQEHAHTDEYKDDSQEPDNNDNDQDPPQIEDPDPHLDTEAAQDTINTPDEEPQDDENTGWEDDPQDIIVDDPQEDNNEDHDYNIPSQDPPQEDFGFDTTDKQPQDDFEFDQDQQPKEKPQDDFGFGNEAENEQEANPDDSEFNDKEETQQETTQDDLGFDKSDQPTKQQEDFGFDEAQKPQEQKEADDFGFDTSNQPKQKQNDDFGFGDEQNSEAKENQDDFGFDDNKPSQKDDFGFEDQPQEKKKTDDGFDFDFEGPSKKKNTEDQDFDFAFESSPGKANTPPQDDFGFDDFSTKKEEDKKEDESPKAKEKEEEKAQDKDSDTKEESFTEGATKEKRGSISLRKLSVEVSVSHQRDNTFMNECVEAIKQDIIN